MAETDLGYAPPVALPPIGWLQVVGLSASPPTVPEPLHRRVQRHDLHEGVDVDSARHHLAVFLLDVHDEVEVVQVNVRYSRRLELDVGFFGESERAGHRDSEVLQDGDGRLVLSSGDVLHLLEVVRGGESTGYQPPDVDVVPFVSDDVP